MSVKQPESGPVEVLRQLDSGEIGERDVVTWAEQQLASTGALADDDAIMALAWLKGATEERSNISKLLEDIVNRHVSFLITDSSFAFFQVNPN